MYKSPIDITYGQMKMQIENDIVRAVQSYNVNVDREELIRALQYDRNQYEKGYMDGKAAMAELVRCKDCIYYEETVGIDSGKPCGYGSCGCAAQIITGIIYDEDFCSYGERKDNGQ